MRIIRNLQFCGILVAIFCLCAGSTLAIESSIIGEVPHHKAEITIDGSLDEAEWNSALSVDLKFEVEPGENIASPVTTQARIFEDSENLYVAFTAHDPEVKRIRAYLSDRDNIDNSDFVSIKLDTFNDSRRAFEFSVNPLGVQADSIIDERTGTTDDSWDAIWHSAGIVTDKGYIVEIQIPFKALRFEDNQKAKTWGVEFNRSWPRDVVHQISNHVKDRNISCDLCQMLSVQGFRSAEAPSNLTVIPGITLLKSDERSLADLQGWQRGETKSRGSLDFRWGISPNTFLNATINPDFSQVEADALQLDVNNLSSIFLTEKRPFFLDGADYFNNWSRLVYTRLFEEPELGIKFTGKSNEHSYGVMSIEDKHTNLLFPYEYGTELLKLENQESKANIFRYRYDLGDNGNIGTTLTSRSSDGFQSEMLSVDGKLWLGQSDFVKFQLISSETDFSEEILAIKPQLSPKVSDNAYSLNYTHSSRDWDWLVTYHQFGEDFRADTGYVNFSNWTRKSFTGRRKWYAADSDSWWRLFSVHGGWHDTQEIDGTNIENGYELNFVVEGVYESAFGVDFFNFENTFIDSSLVSQPFTDFDLKSQDVWLEINLFTALGVELEYAWGDDIDYGSSQPAKVDTIISSFDYQLSQQINTELEYIRESLEVFNNRLYTIELKNFRIAYQIDENSFLRLTFQSRELDFANDPTPSEFLASQLIYSYKVNPFTLFYFGYSDKFLTDINTFDLKKTDKTLFMKFSYAWQL